MEIVIPGTDDVWRLQFTGIHRDRAGAVNADVCLANDWPVYAAPAQPALPASRNEWVNAALAETRNADPPSADALMRALLASVPDTAAVLQEQGETQSPTQTDGIVSLLTSPTSDVELWHSGDMAWATVPVGDHREHWRLDNPRFRQWASRAYRVSTGRTPGAQALHDATQQLSGGALYDGPEHPVYTRVAARAGSIYLDLCDPEWRVIEIDADGWRVADEPPARFRRSGAMQPLPVPEAGDSIDDLRRFVNMPGEAAWRLFVAAVLQALWPTGPYPVLIVHGGQGSAKSTTARVFQRLVDPHRAALRSAPRDVQTLMVAAENGWVVGLDNLNHLPQWLSDAICRLSTGGGFGTRTLYTNTEETIIEAQRPVILNGIEEMATQEDLLARAIVLYLPPIKENERRQERIFWEDFEAARPGVLGAFLTVLSVGLHELSHVHLSSSPRMADFAHLAVATAPGYGWTGAEFLEAYQGNRGEAHALTLDASPVASALRMWAEKLAPGDAWEGTAKTLLGELVGTIPEDARRQPGWPADSTRFSNALRRLQSTLAEIGLSVEFRSRRGKLRPLSITRSCKVPLMPPFSECATDAHSRLRLWTMAAGCAIRAGTSCRGARSAVSPCVSVRYPCETPAWSAPSDVPVRARRHAPRPCVRGCRAVAGGRVA